MGRIAGARANLRACTLCPRRCGVDRLAGELGECRLSAEGRVFRHELSFAEEPEISPTFEILLSGCNHRCRFCSVLPDVLDPARSRAVPTDELECAFRGAIREGARSISFVGGEPTVNLLAILGLLDRLRPSLPVVWNTNSYLSGESRDLLDGIVDVWIADIHFGAERCARRIGGVGECLEPVRESLVWMSGHGRLIVRHLLLPGHGECCFGPIVEWMGARLAGVPLHLLEGYLPPAGRRGGLGRLLSSQEAFEARERARCAGLTLLEE